MGIPKTLKEGLIFFRGIGGYGRGIWNGARLYSSRFYLKIFSLTTFPNTKLTPPTGPIPESYFGMHVNGSDPNPYYGQDVAGWPTVQFGARRLWDCGITWAELESTKGHWDFSVLDKYLFSAQAHNLELLLTFGGTPGWAATEFPQPAMNGGGWASMPKDIQDWRNYVSTVVSHCAGKVKFYEMWNEPDLLPWKGSIVNNLLTLTKEAVPIIRKIDPQAKIISPAFSEDVGIYYQARFLAAGGGQNLDAMAHHFYVEPRGPEAMIPIVQTLRRTMDNYGLKGKPIINSETGWQTAINEQFAEAPDAYITAEKLGGYMARLYIVNWALGLPYAYWYTWDGGTYAGLIDENRKPTSAATAWTVMRSWLLGSTMLSCSSDKQNNWTCQIRRPDKSVATICWNPDSADLVGSPDETTIALYKIKAPATYATDLTGTKKTVGKGSEIIIGIRPILFTD